MNIITIIISLFAVIISLSSLIQTQIWNKSNRINDIKPMIYIDIIENYKEGWVPNAIIDFGQEDGINYNLYLKIYNYGIGKAKDVVIQIKNNVKSKSIICHPFILKNDQTTILKIYVSNFKNNTRSNEYSSIVVYYQDIDNHYYSVEGDLIVFDTINNGKTCKLRSKQIIKKAKKKMVPKICTVAKYI